MKLIYPILLMLLHSSAFGQTKYFVLFDYDKSQVPDTAMAFLIKEIYTQPIESIYLEGHCDSIGSRNYNYGLSERRVNAVKKLLVDNGFDAKKLIGKIGYGKDKPLNHNENEKDRQLNRRVMVILYPKMKDSLDNKRVIENKPIGGTPMLVKDKPNALLTSKVKSDTSEVSKWLLVGTEHKTVGEKPITRDYETKTLDRANFKKNNLIRLSNLLFQPGRHYLRPESVPTLDTLLEIMQENPNLKIEIQGHVCCTSIQDDGYDWDTHTDNLSYNRSQAIFSFLVSKGIDHKRMSYKGFGGTRKIYEIEVDEYYRSQNRRVEILILEN